MNNFFTGLWCAMKNGFYATTNDDQLSGLTEKKLQSTSQSQTCTKKRKKGHGHSLVVCHWSYPLQFSKSQLNHHIWEIFSANWWDALKAVMPEAGIGQQKGPSSFPWQLLAAHHATNASKVEWIGLRNFASSSIFTWSLANWPTLLKHLNNFLQGKSFYKQQEAENAF